MERIDKFISAQLNISRKEAHELIKRHRVSLNGNAVKAADEKLDPERDEVTADGKKVIYRKFVYIMLNKPAGVVCATRDVLSETVLELIPKELRRKGLFPAGRLDKDTEGFVFITDDGALAHKMLSPKSHVEKLYYAELEKDADESDIEAFAEGLVIDGGEKCLPARLEITDDKRRVYITLCEGKYHQVKRMAEARNNKVTYLRRVKIGGINLDEKLQIGECREISLTEIDNIYTN